MTGTSYKVSAEMAEALGPFPGYADDREHVLRVLRNHRRAAWSETAGYEGLHTLPVPLDAAHCPDQPLVEAARAAWDDALAHGRAARRAQRAGHGDRAHRHDRPGHGLRHHRHRARFRAGQVQEAGRRRLLQDHQPDGADRPRDAGLRRPSRSRTSRRYAVGHGTLDGAPGINHATPARPRASPTRPCARSRRRCRPRSTSSTSSTASRWARRSAGSGWA